MSSRTRVALIGAGYISDVHAEALARKWRIGTVFGSVEDLIAAGAADVAHVLVPPDLHRAVAEPLLEVGIHVLLEKPLAASAADCAALVAAADRAGVQLGVNQNFVHHPAYRRLAEVVRGGELGGLVQVCCQYNMPLRQLGAGQVGHWMFRQPKNILLEQAVHPFSQILDLAGAAAGISVQCAPPRDLAPAMPFIDRWQVALDCDRAPAQVYLAFGQDFPVWRLTAICRDGIAEADIQNNRFTVEQATRWPDFWDATLNGLRVGRALRRQGLAGAADYVKSTLKLQGRSDTFYRSMAASLRAFHGGLAAGRVPLDGRFGATLVAWCERVAEQAGVGGSTPAPVPTAAHEARAADVAVLGGTGFIGRHLVRALVAKGLKVSVLARGLGGLPAVFAEPGVTLIQGDVGRPEDVARAIGPARLVVNLAQGVSGTSGDEIVRSMVASATSVAEVCLTKDVDCLVHASTIAALYLGVPGATILDTTPVDPEPAKRAEYARAKAAAEVALAKLHAERGLKVTIVRPGLVVGAGGIAFHSGLGFFNRERHCMGWNRGDNPLPFVLADDVADAILRCLERPATVAGRSYNLVGDVRLTARDYIAELAAALDRPLRFHGQSVVKLQAVELFKWLVKRATGRRDAAMPSYRDLKSRGMPARFDCEQTKRDLGWRPVADRATFVAGAIRVHEPRR